MEKLHLKANKVRILKDSLANLPYMLDKKLTCDRIMQGLIDVVMLDGKHNFCPDFYAILKTKRRSITRSEMRIIEKHFSQFFKIMLEMDHITEKVYDALGSTKDEVSGVL